VTEGVVMADPDRAATILGEMRRMGVGVALDDFGTGHSSLACLHRFPIDVLKVDKSFVDGLGLGGGGEATGLVQAILGMARTLRMSTVAEGIEDVEQLSELAQLGCDNGQGYLLSRPVPAEQLTELLTRPLTPAPAGTA
jgi:EAL domain-containing protein (putative c-di-GMP-specific phosphodiesterase class I)